MNEASEREAFEAWFESDEHNRKTLLYWREGDGYRHDAPYIKGCWNGWKARAAVPAVQPQEPVAWRFRFHTDASLAGQPNVRSWVMTDTEPKAGTFDKMEIEPLYAAPQAEARQEQPKQPDSVYLTSSSGEDATARDAALADGFDGSTVRPGPNHSTIEIWYDTEAQARAAHEVIRDQIDAALSSTPAQGDGGTGGVQEVPRG